MQSRIYFWNTFFEFFEYLYNHNNDNNNNNHNNNNIPVAYKYWVAVQH